MPENQTLSPQDHAREMAHVGAVHRLAMTAVQRPDLRKAEAQARIELAAAIIAFDEVEDRIANGEKIHSLQEQVNVELATTAYRTALMNFLRRES